MSYSNPGSNADDESLKMAVDDRRRDGSSSTMRTRASDSEQRPLYPVFGTHRLHERLYKTHTLVETPQTRVFLPGLTVNAVYFHCLWFTPANKQSAVNALKSSSSLRRLPRRTPVQKLLCINYFNQPDTPTSEAS